MKNINLIFLLFALVIALPFIGKAQKNTKPNVTIDEVNELFKNWDNRDKPGIAVGIVNDGKIVHTTGYGMANLEYDIPITADTRFYIGELANQFTTLSILLLESQNKLSLQDDIRKYVPTLPNLGKQITIEHLIHHTSGLRELAVTKALSGWKNSDEVSTDQAIQLFASQQQLNANPDTKQEKNISTFLLLEKIIAKASGESYTDFIQKNIFDPLQMTNTFFDTGSGTIIKNKATGYYPKGDGHINSTVKQMERYNTNVYSTVGDMCRWLQNYYQPKIGNKALLKRYSAISTVNGQPVAEKNLSPYFSQLQFWDYNGTKKLYHVSVGGGYACKIVHFPDQNISAVVLGNGGTYNGGMATMTGELYVKNYFTRTPGLVEVEGIKMDTKTLENYTGNYWEPNQFYSRNIYLKNDTLMYARGNGYDSPIIPVEKNKFQMITYSKVYVTFDNSNNKKIMFVEAEGEGAFEHIAYQKDAPWAKNLSDYTGEYFCQALKTSYRFSIEDNKLITSNLRTGTIEFTPTIKDSFTGNRRYFNELKFVRNNNRKIKGIQLSTANGDKLWFEKTPISIAKNTKLN